MNEIEFECQLPSGKKYPFWAVKRGASHMPNYDFYIQNQNGKREHIAAATGSVPYGLAINAYIRRGFK